MKFQTPYLPQDIQPCTWSQADTQSQVEVSPNSKNDYGSAEAIIKKTWFLELSKALNWYETLGGQLAGAQASGTCGSIISM